MGTWATASRHEINKTFEAGSGDVVDGAEPVSIWARAKSPNDAAIKGSLTRDGKTLRFAYTVQGDALEVADVRRVFSIAYLDVLTGHYLQSKADTVVLIDRATGTEHTDRYPDPE